MNPSLFLRLVLFAAALVMQWGVVVAQPTDIPTGQVSIVNVDETGALVPHATVGSLGPRSYGFGHIEWKPIN